MAESIVSANKRVANILRKAGADGLSRDFDESLIGDEQLGLRGNATLQPDQSLALELQLRNEALSADIAASIASQAISGRLDAALTDSALIERLSGAPTPAV